MIPTSYSNDNILIIFLFLAINEVDILFDQHKFQSDKTFKKAIWRVFFHLPYLKRENDSSKYKAN